MKKIYLIVSLVVFSAAAKSQTKEQEIEAIKAVCNYYLDGGTNGDSLTFSKAFFPGGLMQYMRHDTVIAVSLKDFMARMPNTGKKVDRKSTIESVEVYGNAAVTKLTIEYPTFFFHDIMSLLKTKEGWKIVGKIFYREMKK